MPIINNFSIFCEQHVKRVETGYQYKLGIPVLPQYLPGQLCKLTALSVVLNSLHHHYGMPQVPPLGKNKKGGYSLRQHAKKKIQFSGR